MKKTIALFEPDSRSLYTIEAASQITGIPRRTIALYCSRRLVSPAQEPELCGWLFNKEAIQALRRLEYLRETEGVNLEGMHVIIDLIAEVERLHRELRSSRGFDENVRSLS